MAYDRLLIKAEFGKKSVFKLPESDNLVMLFAP